jgi:Zn-finger nucleic acid-binding protein
MAESGSCSTIEGMYRGTAIACPACGSALAPLEGSAVSAHVCPACGGTWLGSDASVHIMRGLGDDVTRGLAAVTVDVAKHATVNAPPDVPGRGCPLCGSALYPMNVAGVVVDSCPAHGTWFDRDELGRVATACKKLHEQGELDTPARAPITFEGVLEDTAQIGYGVTKAAVTLVLDLFQAILARDRRERDRERYEWDIGRR